MIGLGNSCRGMKSPPLLVAALLACIIVLGFNYWIASSRSVDLQNQVLELEVRVRRAAAERGAVELKKNEFQGELEKQREQIDKIQSLHSFQMENANKVYQEEKATLMNNITTNERLIHTLQDHLKELQTEYGKLQLDVYRFQKNQTNLQRKFSYDLSQCINQMKELKEQCEERISELTKKSNDVPKDRENKEASEDSKKNPQVNAQLPTFKQGEFQQTVVEKPKADGDLPRVAPTARRADSPQPKDAGPVVVGKRAPGAAEAEAAPASAPGPQPRHGSPAASARPAEAKGGAGREAAAPTAKHRDGGNGHNGDGGNNGGDDEVEREQLLGYDGRQGDPRAEEHNDKQGHEALNKDQEVDYDLDENEAESETEKQAALTGTENNLNVPNQEDNDVKNHLLDQGKERQKL
ncbi:Golgi membrane protein 1 [Nothoprocta perdicaria]|uniref:Golgi membrane protein 1 n=1 Tax=Nothoprocta perdicaria TaxID=30464 RepID=UPI000E1B80A7|nr:Golgi membrane protein 1 [Nothoprocta perdicaria]